MSIIYADSNAIGSNNGASWANAYATIQAALTAWTTADEIWWADDSTETYTAITLTCPNSTILAPVPVYRMDSATDTYSPSPLDKTDVRQMILNHSASDLIIDCFVVWHGIRVECGDDFEFSNYKTGVFYDCDIAIGLQSTSSLFDMATITKAIFINCAIRADIATSNEIRFKDTLELRFIGCKFPFNNPPSGLMSVDNGLNDAQIEFDDCDLTELLNNILVETAVHTGTNDDEIVRVMFRHCKFKAGYLLWDSTLDAMGTTITAEACSVGSDSFINESVVYNGVVTTSTSAYFNSGYQDEGATNLSQVITTNARCLPHTPVISSKILGIIESAGLKTFTVELVENFTSALTARECWLELYYFDSASNSNRVIDTSSKEFAKSSYTALSAGNGLVSWTGEPAGARSVKLEVTVTVNKTGLYFGLIHLGKYEAGKVLHIDPMFGVA